MEENEETDNERLERQEQVYTAWEADQLREGALKRGVPKGSAPKGGVLKRGMLKEDAPGDRVEAVPWEKAEGRIALEYAYLYPPGIPLVVPGERIGKAAAEQLSAYEQMGFSIEGTEAEGKIEVWING